MSGISPSEECLGHYQAVKTGKNAWGVFCIQDDKTVEMVHLGEKFGKDANFEETSWQALMDYAEENLVEKAAYIVSEFRSTTADGRDVNKLVLISWCPENKIKSVKAKMLHGSTLNAIKQTFDGLQGKPIQASCFGDLAFADVKKETI